MSNDKSEHYIKIARACLRAINDVSRNNSSRDESVKQVYSAIEDAFATEMGFYRDELSELTSALESIASGKLSEEQARQLAQNTLKDKGHWSDPGSQLH